MCYSLSLFSDIHALVRRFGAEADPSLTLPRAAYVSAFTLPVFPVIANENPRRIQGFRWGLVPAWVEREEKARRIRFQTFNARFETLSRRPSFQRAIQRRRCLVLVDGFFEFREVGGRKFPYFIRLRSRQPFALAGLWDAWKHPGTGEVEKTFSIVTVPANTLLARIHNTKKRMPLILDRAGEEGWLSRALRAPEVQALAGAFNEKVLEAYPVAPEISSRHVDGSRMSLLRRVGDPEREGKE